MTILGDRAQTMDEAQQDVLRFLPKIFGKQIRKIVLNKSYRNTTEITEYANRLIGLTGLDVFERHGKPVVEHIFQNQDAALAACLKALNLSVPGAGESGYETAAILAMTEQEAIWIYERLKEQIPVTYLDRNSDSFRKGLTVTTFYLAKGLEFDQVFVWGRPEHDKALIRQAEYICATRALHELYVMRVADKDQTAEH